GVVAGVSFLCFYFPNTLWLTIPASLFLIIAWDLLEVFGILTSTARPGEDNLDLAVRSFLLVTTLGLWGELYLLLWVGKLLSKSAMMYTALRNLAGATAVSITACFFILLITVSAILYVVPDDRSFADLLQQSISDLGKRDERLQESFKSGIAALFLTLIAVATALVVPFALLVLMALAVVLLILLNSPAQSCFKWLGELLSQDASDGVEAATRLLSLVITIAISFLIASILLSVGGKSG